MHSKMNATVGNYMEQLSALASNAMLVNRTCMQAVRLALMQMSAGADPGISKGGCTIRDIHVFIIQSVLA